MSKIQITYELDCDFEQSLRLIAEIETETGMLPINIVDEGKNINYHYNDALQVIGGELSTDEYLKTHLVL